MDQRLGDAAVNKVTLGSRIANEVERIIGKLTPGRLLKKRAAIKAETVGPRIRYVRDPVTGVAPFAAFAARDALKTRPRAMRRAAKEVKGAR